MSALKITTKSLPHTIAFRIKLNAHSLASTLKTPEAGVVITCIV
jgi:hypothetical protein